MSLAQLQPQLVFQFCRRMNFAFFYLFLTFSPLSRIVQPHKIVLFLYTDIFWLVHVLRQPCQYHPEIIQRKLIHVITFYKGFELKIQCNLCDSTFRSKPDLMQHRKKQHCESVKHCRDDKKVGIVNMMRKSVGLFILNVRKSIHLKIMKSNGSFCTTNQ